MARQSWIYTKEGVALLKGSPECDEYLARRDTKHPAVFGDEPDFVSPIDGRVYSGKAGMREHNARHDVVNNRDLKGLPVGFAGRAPEPSPSERREMRRAIEEAARRKGYLDGQ